MTELEKLDAGLEYDFCDEGVNARKLHAIEGCAKLNAIPVTDDESQDAAISCSVRWDAIPPSCRV